MEITSFLIGLGIGIGLTSIVTFIYLVGKIDARKAEQLSTAGKKFTPMVLAAVMVAIFIVGQVAVTLAQTPVPLEIPTDVIFTEANNWITTFAPIAAIGIGITIALAVLGYIGKMIASAFKG